MIFKLSHQPPCRAAVVTSIGLADTKDYIVLFIFHAPDAIILILDVVLHHPKV
jgi:hypothetical protein